MNRTRPALPAFFGLIFIAGCLIAAFLTLTAVNSYPRQAQELFGPPAPELSALQRYRLSYKLVQEQEGLLTALDPAGPEIRFTIPPGEPVAVFLDRLEFVGLVADQGVLRDYLVYTGRDTQLQTGEFVLNPGMTAVEVVEALLDPTPRFVTVAVLPGWRLEELAASLPTTGLSFSGEAFLAAAHTRPEGFPSLAELPAGASMEGFFLPGSYELPREAAPEELIAALLQAFEDQVGPDLRAGFSNQGLTLYQAVILASIVERETVIEEEMPLIASVFLNRLAIEMKLETDPTVQYAIGYNQAQGTWWTNPLTYADLEVDSPYNTYRYPGLPPGPIASPSIAALQAVAFPAETPYFYFRAACDGSGRHNFAQTYQEHLGNGCE